MPTAFQLYILLTWIAVNAVLGIPTWEGFHTRDTIGSIVTGAGYIEALGPVRSNRAVSCPICDARRARSPKYGI